MKSKDQTLLEEAYEATKRGVAWIKLGQDEKGAYREKLGDYGKPPLKSKLDLYDSEGNKLPADTALAPGQIEGMEAYDNKYFEVTKEGDEFIGKRFEPSSEVKSTIIDHKKGRIKKDEEQAMKHFFPKN